MELESVSILVVDDVNAMRVQVKDLLRSFGFRKISTAANGEEAKILLEIESFHLVLSDWRMEPTDGLALLKFLRAHPKHAATGFVMVTAEGTKERVVEAIQAGIDDYLIKPLTLGQIQTKVFRVLVKRKVVAPAAAAGVGG